MQKFIVTGVPTSGKTTLSKMLIKKYAVSHIDSDPIIGGFEDIFPVHGITHNVSTLEGHLKVCQNFKPFLFRMINGLKNDSFVIDGFRLPLEDLKINYPEIKFVVLGYPNATKQERLNLCRKYGKNSWTAQESDENMLIAYEFLIQESKRLEMVCKKLNIAFIDTHDDFENKLKEAINRLE